MLVQKISDFGLATQLTRPDEKHLTMCGTPNFISPEVASRGSHGLEADVWGLGCLLYTLLVGRPPFETQGVKSTLTRVVMDDYRLPSYLSPEARDLINSLLQKNPKDRISLEQILEHPFIKRSSSGAMTNNTTQDSGIHTMSSRRESAFSDGALLLPPSMNGRCGKANSDCMPSNNCPPNRFLGGSLDQLTNRFQNANLHPCSNRTEQVSVFSQAGSCCHQNSCNCPRFSHCTNRFQSSDPGGGSFSCQRFNSCCSGASCANRNFASGHTVEHMEQPQAKPVEVRPKFNGLEPLCAKRLLPTRHQTKNAILSILENREVCVEFIKRRGQFRKEMVCEVCRISPDGLRIVLYEPEGGKGVAPSASPPALPADGTDQIFSFESLPEKHWKKYSYAAKFVDLVRAKTPKVTYHTDKAKCLLMENLTDFEACFHEGGFF